MTHDVKSYCLADAAAALALSSPSASDAELKGILAMASDVPAERIDTCFAELKAGDMFSALRGMAMVAEMALGHKPSVDEIRDVFQSCVWNDDGNNQATVNLTIASEDGSEDAKISVTKRY